MSKPRVYQLELTAEEVAEWGAGAVSCIEKSAAKLRALYARMVADREADELRLPWKVDARTGIAVHADGYSVAHSNGNGATPVTRLASAAPELLEAVKAAELAMRLADNSGANRTEVCRVMVLIARALRKVSTGVPE